MSFYSYGEITIGGETPRILIYTRKSLSKRGGPHLFCHRTSLIESDSEPPVKLIPTCEHLVVKHVRA